MKKRKPDPSHAAELRRKAEERLQLENPLPEEISPAESQKLIHELRVHQIELEMQNDELRQAQEILEESRSRYSDLYDFAPIGYLTLDELGIIREANLTAARQLAVERSRLIDRQLTHFMVTEDKGGFRRHLNLVLKGRERQTCELRLKRKGGSEFFTLLESAFYQDTAGRSLCRTAFTDITARRQAEADLKESEARYRSLFQHNHAVMLLIDPTTGDIVDANPAACAFYGYPHEELISRKITDINMLPKDRVFKEMQRAGSEQRRQFFFRHRLAGDEVRDVEVFSGPIRLQGQDLLYSIIHDITARKQAEESLREREAKFRAAIETSGDGFCISDMAGRFLEFNDAYVNLLGYSREELLKMSVSDIEAQFTAAEIAATIERVKSEGHVIFETKHRSKDGRVWPAEVNLSYWPIADGRMFVFLRDITERTRAEEELRQALQEAEKSQKEAEALLRASRAVMNQHTFADAAWEIFESCRETIGAPAGYVSLLSDTGDNNEVVFLESGGLPCTVDPDLPMPIRGLRAESYRTGEVVYDNDFAHNKYVKFLPEGHVALDNVLFAPMVHEAKVVGLLGLSNKPGGFTPYDARLAAGFASLAAIALVSRRGEEMLNRLNEGLEQRVQERTADLRLTVEQLQWEIIERQRVEGKLRESEEHLRLLTFQLLNAQETERKRIAVELHDGLGQALMVSKMRLRAIMRSVLAGEPKEECEDLLGYLDEVIENVRRLSHDLMPPALEDLGLQAALSHLLDEFARYSGIRLSTDLEGIQDLFSPEKQLIIYRIFQEGLNNITKHAHASEVSVSMKREPEGVSFRLKDNGEGFDIQNVLASDSTKRGLGLAAMDERVQILGGDLKLWSQPGQGTRLQFTVPLSVDNPKV
jgi:PAS domain S-box-containing protein